MPKTGDASRWTNDLWTKHQGAPQAMIGISGDGQVTLYVRKGLTSNRVVLELRRLADVIERGQYTYDPDP